MNQTTPAAPAAVQSPYAKKDSGTCNGYQIVRIRGGA